MPTAGSLVSYKMSLEERSRMLGIDHQRADIGAVEQPRRLGDRRLFFDKLAGRRLDSEVLVELPG